MTAQMHSGVRARARPNSPCLVRRAPSMFWMSPCCNLPPSRSAAGQSQNEAPADTLCIHTGVMGQLTHSAHLSESLAYHCSDDPLVRVLRGLMALSQNYFSIERYEHRIHAVIWFPSNWAAGVWCQIWTVCSRSVLHHVNSHAREPLLLHT